MDATRVQGGTNVWLLGMKIFFRRLVRTGSSLKLPRSCSSTFGLPLRYGMRRLSMWFAISLSIEPGSGDHSDKEMSPTTSLVIRGRSSSKNVATSDSTDNTFGTEGPGRESARLKTLANGGWRFTYPNISQGHIFQSHEPT